MSYGKAARRAFGGALGLLAMAVALGFAGTSGMNTAASVVLGGLLCGAAVANLVAFLLAWRGLVREPAGPPWLIFSLSAVGLILTLSALGIFAEYTYMRLFVMR